MANIKILDGGAVYRWLKALGSGTESDPFIPAQRDDGPSWTVVDTQTSSADMSGAAADLTDAPASGETLVITDLVISTDTNMTLTLKEETSGTIFWVLYLAADNTIQITPRSHQKLETADKKLQGQTSVAGNISITASYFSEA